MTVTLSGFADEISPDPREQLATLAAESIRHLELRSAWSVNVADFTSGQLAGFRALLADAGVRVSAIGSPIGKIPLGAPLGPELDRMRRIADIARELGSTIVRDSGFEGFVSLEPHLVRAGRYGGFSGPEGFTRASHALKIILNELGIPWR